MLLAMTAADRGYTSSWWGTCRQVNEQGGWIRKGQNHENGKGATYDSVWRECFVANATSSPIPASRHRSRSDVHDSGRYSSRSISARDPPAGTSTPTGPSRGPSSTCTSPPQRSRRRTSSPAGRRWHAGDCAARTPPWPRRFGQADGQPSGPGDVGRQDADLIDTAPEHVIHGIRGDADALDGRSHGHAGQVSAARTASAAPGRGADGTDDERLAQVVLSPSGPDMTTTVRPIECRPARNW